MDQQLPSTVLVIFGVSGDLSHRYLLPALAEICKIKTFRSKLRILGLSRRAILVEDILPTNSKALAGQIQTVQIDYDQAAEYHKLKDQLDGLAAEQVIFYFAVPPQAVLPVVKHLGDSCLNTSKYRLLLEKPFGTDLASAHQLIKETHRHFKETQIYRIDHYLAKEMAQNIAVFLGSNSLIRNIWDNRLIEKIDIIVEESLGIEGRAHFYEQTGALRDIVQSHALQLAALVLMEPCPNLFDFSQMPERRLKALDQLSVDMNSVVTGQYAGYKKEVANPDSTIETFISLRLKSSDPKWTGVPIQISTGKALKEKLTDIKIFFKKSNEAESNLLHLRIQPKEGIELELWVKKPGYEQELQKLPQEFIYKNYFGRLPDVYEQVIVDAMRSRSNLFAGSGEVLRSWEIIQPIIDRWDKSGKGLVTYKSGSTIEDVINK